MDRKDFCKKTFQIGITSGAMLLCSGKPGFPQSDQSSPKKKPTDADQKFKEDWIQSLMKNLDTQFDKTTRIKLMISCGRDCARRGAIQIAKSSKGDLEKMLKTLAKYIGKDNVRNDGKRVHLKYSKCYCHLVHKGPARLSDTYCHCSRGWILELFETCLGKPVAVELKKAIKRGDPYCQFIVQL